MRVSIEWFLLDNWLMNIASLLLASALCGMRPRRVLGPLLSFLGAVYALISMAVWPFLLMLPFRLLMGAGIALGLRHDGWRGFLRAYISVLLCALMLGGLLFALSLLESERAEGYGFINGMLVGTVRMRIVLLFTPLAALIPRFFRQARSAARIREQLIRVRVTIQGVELAGKALLDTGNLLTEPLSGLPVMLINTCPHMQNGYPVRYGGAGGGGMLTAHRPERAQAWLNGAWRELDVMIAPPPTAIVHADALLGSIALPSNATHHTEGGYTRCDGLSPF